MMDIQDLRHAYDLAAQQVNVLDVYLHELTQRCERLSMNTDTDFDYITFKLKIMTEVKKLYEHYRDMKHQQFQEQCASELTEILHQSSDDIDLHDDSYHDNDLHLTSTPIHDDLDIHQVPSLLSPIEDISFFTDLHVPDLIDTDQTPMDFESDLMIEQLRHV